MEDTTTIRFQRKTIARLREYKKHPRATDDEVLNQIIDKLVDADKEILKQHDLIVKLHDAIERLTKKKEA